MTQDHPITPPPELVQQWLTEGHHQDYCSASEHAIAQAAQWGADQELEAFQAWLSCKGYRSLASDLLAARRPKPPSLKEQALAYLAEACLEGNLHMMSKPIDTIRRALEALDD